MERKQILLINDVAGNSKVGMGAMIPVLSYLGYPTFNLPTALVSNTFDYGRFAIQDTTEFIRQTLPVWKELGFSHDAICTGCMLVEEQVHLVANYCREQREQGTMVFVDPVMGDGGRLYNGMTMRQVELMRKMVSVADLTFPNYTEAALLAEMEYREEGISWEEAKELLDRLRKLGARSVLVTSCRCEGTNSVQSMMPQRSELDAKFVFVGNRIRGRFDAHFNCPITLPDTLESVRDIALMDSIRPIPLEDEEAQFYAEYYKPTVPDTIPEDTVEKKVDFWKDIMWDIVGDNLFTSIRAENKTAYFKLSPIINPQYLSYSHRHGLSYKMRLGARFNFSAHRYLTLEPTFGYNFKRKQFYLNAPLRMTYNPKREGYAEIEVGNGNRITNSSVIETIGNDSTDYSTDELDLFSDNYIEIRNNVEAFDWLTIMTSIAYHRRKAVNAERMKTLGLPTDYRSFAPVLTLKLRPWQKGPLFVLDIERGIKGIWKSNIGFERWELDGVWKIPMRSLSLLNIRVGGGFYTDKSTSYFVDYANFRDNNIPGGWDDDWTGQFQLVDSKWYNESDYYVRTNLSYESPLLMATWLPLVGRYIETERIYLSGLLLSQKDPYTEVGYGLTNRYFSAGLFASFLGGKFWEFGGKISVELFRKW